MPKPEPWSYENAPKGALPTQKGRAGQYYVCVLNWFGDSDALPVLKKVEPPGHSLQFKGNFFFDNYWDAYAYYTKEKAKKAKLASGGAGQ